ncbi:MAG: hypothetical protein M1817_003166 [Caeruleum heppii]|nr:MAG: hypothetical protein M1817_003166 [Caeruleum heppii]
MSAPAGGPDSQKLPLRTTSSSSYASEGAIPDEDPSETAALLRERLRAWKHACVDLESYVEATQKAQRAQAKEYEKIAKSLSNPLRQSEHFDSGLGGVVGLFECIKSNTQGIANFHNETEGQIKGSILPVLDRLHTEIKNKDKELGKGVASGTKSVDKARNLTQKHIEMLGQHSASYETPGHHDPSTDPYVLQRGIYFRLNKQIHEENASRQDLLSVQDNFQQFEAHVLAVIEQAMGSFVQFLGGQADRTKSLYMDMLSKTQHIPPDFEWKNFVNRNGHILINPNAPPRSVETVNFPNQNHPATKPLIEGTLERKSRLVVKSYSSGYYVVTPSKLLHEFKDNDNFRNDPTPEMSLYLPDCTVGEIDGPKFVVKGKDASKGKVGNKLSTTHDYVFKAHSAGDAEQWARIIRSLAGGSNAEVPGVSEPSSPVAQRQTSGVQQSQRTETATGEHGQPAPLKTQGLPPQGQQSGVTGGPQVASPMNVTPQSAGGAGAGTTGQGTSSRQGTT